MVRTPLTTTVRPKIASSHQGMTGNLGQRQRCISGRVQNMILAHSPFIIITNMCYMTGVPPEQLLPYD